MESTGKVIKVIKTGKRSYDMIGSKIRLYNIDKYQVVGRMADIIESELRKNKTEVGRCTIMIKSE